MRELTKRIWHPNSVRTRNLLKPNTKQKKCFNAKNKWNRERLIDKRTKKKADCQRPRANKITLFQTSPRKTEAKDTQQSLIQWNKFRSIRQLIKSEKYFCNNKACTSSSSRSSQLKEWGNLLPKLLIKKKYLLISLNGEFQSLNVEMFMLFVPFKNAAVLGLYMQHLLHTDQQTTHLWPNTTQRELTISYICLWNRVVHDSVGTRFVIWVQGREIINSHFGGDILSGYDNWGRSSLNDLM